MFSHVSGFVSVLSVLVTLALLVLAVAVIVFLIRCMLLDAEQRHTDPAEAELRRRYAEGLIGAEEYHKRLAESACALTRGAAFYSQHPRRPASGSR